MLSWVILGLALAAAPPASAREVSPMEVREVTDALLCQCSCNMGLSACSHENCPFAIPERAAIERRLAAGEKPEAIIASYAEKYGDKILAAPRGSGFGIVAWVAPFAMLLAGGFVVLRLIRSWSRPAEGETEALAGAAPGPSPARQVLVDRVEAELRREES